MTTSTIVVDTVITDFIACNSGTCTGEFSSNQITANTVNSTGAITGASVDAGSGAFTGNVSSDSITINSASIAGAVTAGSLNTNSIGVTGGITTGSIDANSGAFAISLTVGGESVLTESYVPSTRYYVSTAPVQITNMPGELNLFGDSPLYTQKVDLSNMSEVRFLATQTDSGSSNARMRANYATGFGTIAADYSGSLSLVGPNGGVELDISSGDAIHDSGWLTLNPAAKAPVYLGVVVSGGNGTADPQFGHLVVEFR